MDFVASINYGFRQYQEASRFMCEHMGFAVLAQDEISITINNGVLSIRLHESEEDQLSVKFDLEVTDYREAIEKYKAMGFHPITDHQNVTQFRIQQGFSGPFGIRLLIYQVLNEDDLGIPTDLKITLDWEEEAVNMAQTFLKHVAINFRELARKKMVAQAESFAIIEGTMEVTKDDMIKAFLYTTPYFKQDDLQKMLVEHGVSQEFINQHS